MTHTYVKVNPKCPICGKDMIIDDIDYNFEGCQDEYWMCPTQDHYICHVKVRYDKVCKRLLERIQ